MPQQTSNLVTDYKYGIKEQVVTAMRPDFGSEYPDPQLAGRVHVLTSYPVTMEQFPAVYVDYIEDRVYNAGVGHKEKDDTDKFREYKHFFFEGSLSFKGLARNPLDRDLLSAGLINIIGFTPVEFGDFFTRVHDGDFVRIQLNTDTIRNGGDGVVPVEWQGKNERIFTTTYTIRVLGDFYSDSWTGQLIEIDQVGIYPYRLGDPEPTGSSDPAPWV